MDGTLVVAGLWVRPLAESARQAGWRVIALDLFGDADTLRASAQWRRIGDPATLAITPALLREALQLAARERGVIGWVAASGFESLPQALAMRVPGLPRLGMIAAAIRRVRAPAFFFHMLDALALGHPEISLRAPASPKSWLAKSAAGSGGWHIRAAGSSAAGVSAGTYWQRMQAGQPMSALFLADGRRARLVALNRLIVRPIGALPFVYHGAVGPIHDPMLTQRLEEALAAMVPAFALRGLASLDFLVHEGQPLLLEVNPRPSATMVLHAHAWPGGLMQAHVRAAQGTLPQQPAAHPPGLRGCLTVFADRACRVTTEVSAELARCPDCHDLPAGGTRYARGEPVCSVSADGDCVEEVLAALDARAAQVRSRLACAEELAA